MRYLPKILGAALLLSAGLLLGSGPAAATMPGLLDRSAVTPPGVRLECELLAAVALNEMPRLC